MAGVRTVVCPSRRSTATPCGARAPTITASTARNVLHRVRPAGNRPKVEGYDDEERTAHVHESGTDRHNAPRPAVRTARVEHHIEAPSRRSRSANVAWLIIVVALFFDFAHAAGPAAA